MVELLRWVGTLLGKLPKIIHVFCFAKNFAYVYFKVSCLFFSNLGDVALTFMTSRTSQ